MQSLKMRIPRPGNRLPSRSLLIVAAVVAATLVLPASVVGAQGNSGNSGAQGNSNDQGCDGNHIPGSGGPSIQVTAPEGQLITGYCVKAGSANQGDGPEYVTVDPPASSVTITHSSEKDVSHYVVSYTTAPETTTTSVPESTTTTTTTSVPESTTTTTTTSVPETTTTTTTVPTEVLGEVEVADSAEAVDGTPAFTG